MNFDLSFVTLQHEVSVYCLAFYVDKKTDTQNRVNRLPNNPSLFSTILPDMSPRSNQKPALGQRST